MLRIKIKFQDRNANLPLSGYAAYISLKFFLFFKPYTHLLERIETLSLKNEIKQVRIEKPIYITGLARAGTTILLEMLSKHPDLASHQYKHLLLPYIPYWIQKLTELIPIYSEPMERIHQDGIMVTQDSPEAVEEFFWRRYFKNIKKEKFSDILSEEVINPKFEEFYLNHIKKLILSQNSSRYLAKNNYNITRMDYILRIFPSAKFLIIIRNPINHIASLKKQERLFDKLEQNIPILYDWMKILGHQEFSHNRICINVNNLEEIRKIRELWKFKSTHVKGWAHYWNSIYNYTANSLEANKNLKEAALIINYDELCDNPVEIIDRILEHCELSFDKFIKIKEYYVNNLHKPDYYIPEFSEQEITDIHSITKKTAARFGLKTKKQLIDLK
ncbi:MAG: sulfotransferase [Promethearchaeota archaeon]